MRNDAGDYRAIGREQKEAAEIPAGYHFYKPDNITSQGNALVEFAFEGCNYSFRSKTPLRGLARLARAGRIHRAKNSVQYVRKLDDFAVIQVSQLWSDTGTGNFTDEKLYVVQTGIKTIQRCILMATDPGDLVLDPTCGSGTTATVAEQWGRRWITIDTSRVALALARARLMGARYPYYLLADSRDGQIKEAEVSRSTPSSKPAYNDMVLCTSECRTSLSNRSPTTPTSM
jgi:adenine-specific DNA-methyltransferase